jgi:hypothetical protein
MQLPANDPSMNVSRAGRIGALILGIAIGAILVIVGICKMLF